MIIKNSSNERQTIKVAELTGEHREYDVCLQPNSVTDIDVSLVIPHIEKYPFLEIEGEKAVASVPEVAPVEEKVEATPVVEDVKEEKEVVKEEPTEDAKPTAHICDICGAEFASARSLTTHKNKAHAE